MLSFLHKHLLLIIGILALAFVFTEAVFALPVRFITWEPERLAPSSVAPGEEMTYTATFTPSFPMPKVGAVTALLTGPAADFLTSLTIALPPETKNTLHRGTDVPVRLSVRVPLGATVGSYPGTLTLRYGEDGLRVLFAPDLAVDITVSTVPVPPDPGKAGKETIAGIDANANGVRDDVERFIVFSYPDLTPEHENTRNALFQYAGAAQEGLLVAEDKEAARATSEELQHSLDCLRFVIKDLERVSETQTLVQAHVLNTVERTRANSRFSSQLSGKVFKGTPRDQLAEQCQFIVLDL